MIFAYIIIVLVGAVFGSVTGMGGGVIIKPLFDIIGQYDAVTIGILSSVSVLCMSLVTVISKIGIKVNVKIYKLILLALASAIGGVGGNFIFDLVKQALNNNSLLVIIQNSLLAVILVLIFFYMINQSKIKSFGFSHSGIYIACGLVLGVISSFLGIGGGPLNVAVLVLLFNLDIKTAAFSSIIIIIFSQIAKLGTIMITTNISEFDLKMLPYLAAASVAGGMLGSILSKKITPKTIVLIFNIMLIVIFILCIANIIRYSLM